MGEASEAPEESATNDPPAPADPGTAAASAGTGTVTDEVRAERLAELRALIDLMRPSVQADGGDLVLIGADVESGVVEVQLQGACSSCAVSSSTLQGGVERILTQRLPWVSEVVGSLDDSIDPFESASLGQGGYVPRY
jgi:Fe-S cluster biogenesis protein NfuA